MPSPGALPNAGNPPNAPGAAGCSGTFRATAAAELARRGAFVQTARSTLASVRRLVFTVLFRVLLHRLASDTACRVGGAVGVLVMHLGFRRQVARQQLARALGLRGVHRARTTRQAFASMGAAFFDLFAVGGPSGPEQHFTIANPLFAQQLCSKGAVFITPHLGSWDIAAHCGTPQVGRVMVFAKPLHDRVLDALVNQQRDRLQLEVLMVNQGDRREALRAIRRVAAGESLGVLPDQRPAGNDSRPAAFLGHACQVIAGPSMIAQRCRVPVVPVVGIRSRAGRVRVLFTQPLIADDEDALRQKVCDAMSALIAAFPGQYMWTHRRLRDETPLNGTQTWRNGLQFFRT